MASVANVILLNETNLSGNKISESVSLQEGSDKFIASLKMANKSGTPTLAGKIEHSTDKNTWHTLYTFTGLTNNGVEIGQISANVLPNVRANLTLSGGSCDVLCLLWFDPKG